MEKPKRWHIAAVIEVSNNAIISIDRKGRIVNWNPAAEKMLGYSPQEVIGRNVSLLVPPDQKHIRVEYHRQLQNGHVISTETYRLHKNGSYVPVYLTISPILRRGRIVGEVAILCDLSERQHAHERFEKAFRASPGLMSIHDLTKGAFLDANDNFIKSVGFLHEELIGKKPTELNLWAKPEEQVYIWHQITSRIPLENFEIQLRIRNGEIRTGLISTQYIVLNGQECVLAAVTDITEKKKFEDELLRLDRLNLVGQMAASIGHEVRNPLTTVRGFLQYLSGRPDKVPKPEHLSLMIEELDRANSIITEFLALAKNRVTNLESVNLAESLKAILTLIQAEALEAGRNLTVDLRSVPLILADVKEVRQLLLNLMRNALEATNVNGQIALRVFSRDNSVVLHVENDGLEIPSAVLSKLGTPFFTTKDNGTGLGLPICYSIAERHNAAISIESKPGCTRFEVVFPSID